MQIKVDPKNGAPRIMRLANWIYDEFQHDTYTDAEVTLANLLECLVDKGILTLPDIPRIMESSDKLEVFPRNW